MGTTKDDGTEVAYLLGNVVITPLLIGNAQFDPRKVRCQFANRGRQAL